MGELHSGLQRVKDGRVRRASSPHTALCCPNEWPSLLFTQTPTPGFLTAQHPRRGAGHRCGRARAGRARAPTAGRLPPPRCAPCGAPSQTDSFPIAAATQRRLEAFSRLLPSSCAVAAAGGPFKTPGRILLAFKQADGSASYTCGGAPVVPAVRCCGPQDNRQDGLL